MKAEQRQHPRYRLSDVQFHVFNHGLQVSGRLINLSLGGLAVQYVPGSLKTAECRAIDILGPEADRFYLSGISCRHIYNIHDLSEGRKFTGVETCLCGLQFIDLTGQQTQKLTDLINRYGVIVQKRF